MATSEQAYYAKVMPYARKVEAALGIPAELEAAFWSWETDYGTNGSSKANNHGGILKNSSGRDYVAGAYAGYNSMDNFVKDRIRILSMNGYGYPAVIAAARAGKGYEAITKAHNASSWSADDYNVATIVARAKAAGGLSVPNEPGKPGPALAECPHCRKPVFLRPQ